MTKMSRRLMRAAACVAVGVVGCMHGLGVEASGGLVSASTQPNQTCPAVVTDDGTGVHTTFACPAEVSSNAVRVSPTVGVVTITATLLGATTFPCGTASTSTVQVSFSYQDAFGTITFNNGSVPYFNLGGANFRCTSNYAGLAAPLAVIGTGAYASVSELCGYSMSAIYGTTVSDDEFATMNFRADNAATGTCVPSNS